MEYIIMSGMYLEYIRFQSTVCQVVFKEFVFENVLVCMKQFGVYNVWKYCMSSSFKMICVCNVQVFMAHSGVNSVWKYCMFSSF